MRIDSIHHHDYTTIVDGNGGEEQTVITSVFRQDGKCSLHVLHVSVDSEVLTICSGLVESGKAHGFICNSIKFWDRPNAIGGDTSNNAARITDEWSKNCFAGE